MKMHENYDTKTFENDIAVLTLDRTVPFSKTVYPICLPPKGELFANRRAFVIGELSFKLRLPSWISNKNVHQAGAPSTSGVPPPATCRRSTCASGTTRSAP